MYGLTQEQDISFLCDATLLQVCIGRNDLILNFDKGVRLTILSDFSVGSDQGLYVRFDTFLAGGSALLPLLSDVIVEAGATSIGGLQLRFKSGARIEVFDTSKEYESFWISDGDVMIVV